MINTKYNHVGEVFGRLVVMYRTEDYVSPSGRKFDMWHCKCECGNEKDVVGASLRKGLSNSCGCLHNQMLSESNKVHGCAKDRLYKVWKNIRCRCYCATHKQYEDYGGRGIRMCDEWYNNYLFFKEWAYTNGYNDNAERLECTLDRIDVNGNYCPENCRWVDMKIQSNNKRNNHYIEFDDETHTLSEWSKITGISYDAIKNRIKHNWSIEKALTTPVQVRRCNNA